MDKLKKLPHWVWYVGGGVVGLVVLFLIARQGSSGSSSSSAGATVPTGTGSASTSTADEQALNEISGQLSQVNTAYEGLTSVLQSIDQQQTAQGSSSATQQQLQAGASGLLTQNGNTYKYYVTGPGQGLDEAASYFYGNSSAGPSVVQHFNPTATSDSNGLTFWTVPSAIGEGVGTPVYGGQPPAGAYAQASSS